MSNLGPICVPKSEKCTQTDSSYTMMSKQRKDKKGQIRPNLEKSISELVRKGRSQIDNKLIENVRKRKIPSTIQFAQTKRKRKSRIRKRKRSKKHPASRRYHHETPLIIFHKF